LTRGALSKWRAAIIALAGLASSTAVSTCNGATASVGDGPAGHSLASGTLGKRRAASVALTGLARSAGVRAGNGAAASVGGGAASHSLTGGALGERRAALVAIAFLPSSAGSACKCGAASISDRTANSIVTLAQVAIVQDGAARAVRTDLTGGTRAAVQHAAAPIGYFCAAGIAERRACFCLAGFANGRHCIAHLATGTGAAGECSATAVGDGPAVLALRGARRRCARCRTDAGTAAGVTVLALRTGPAVDDRAAPIQVFAADRAHLSAGRRKAAEIG